MGMNLNCMLYLQEKGFLSDKKNKILDIGPQNVYFCTEEQIEKFVRGQGGDVDSVKFKEEAKRLAYFSTPRPDETTTLFAELTDLADIEYVGFDVCPAIKTEIFDLNYDVIDDDKKEYYDVVLNFGTTEHVFNQWNSFEVMHDALKVGGVLYSVLPASGYLDHGYYCYTPLFFADLAKANGYEIVDLFMNYCGHHPLDADVRQETALGVPRSKTLQAGQDQVPNFDIHVVMRKQRSGNFTCALEVATAHSDANAEVSARYQSGDVTNGSVRNYRKMTDSELVQACARLEREKSSLLRGLENSNRTAEILKRDLDAVYQSKSWKITKPLRSLMGYLRLS